MNKLRQEHYWAIIGCSWLAALLIIIGRSNIPIPSPDGPSAALIREPMTASSTTTTIKKPINTKPQVPYEKILGLYSSRRIQFNESCQALPSKQTYANKTVIMLDNRSAKTRKIKVDTTTYTVKPYDYAIITLKSTTLPMVLHISCDSQMNVAEITLQK